LAPENTLRNVGESPSVAMISRCNLKDGKGFGEARQSLWAGQKPAELAGC